ncbi:hypothetical protein [Streptomyces griseochromogenes]|uniref:hypothetical protein n=1 Tax=Streptomyces griseochromogenes TaxID=68214 RepID=UPI0037B997C2
MSSAMMTPFAAMFGVVGTLSAPVLSQRSQAKALAADFDRQQRAARAQWQGERERADPGARDTRSEPPHGSRQ